MLLIACTQGENSILSPSEISKPNEAEIVDDSKAIIELAHFNDSLIASRPQTKSFFSSFRRACIVSFADLKGAVSGFVTTAPVLGVKVGYTVAGIYGIAASAEKVYKEAYNTNDPYAAGLKAIKMCRNGNHVLFNQIMSVYIGTTALKKVEEDYPYINRVDINIPEEYEESEDVAKVHNMAMSKLLNQECVDLATTQVLISPQDILYSYIDDEDFKVGFYKYLEREDSYDLSFDNSFCTPRERRILQLFLDLLNSYPEDMNDINFLINGYVKIIEEDKDITSEEKTAIYIAVSVAAYSTDLWNQVLLNAIAPAKNLDDAFDASVDVSVQ